MYLNRFSIQFQLSTTITLQKKVMKKNILIPLLLICIVFIFSNHTIAQIKKTGEQLFTQQKKDILKFNILSAAALEHIEVTYERAIKPRQSIEAKIGLIGVGIITHERVSIFDENDIEKRYRAVNNGLFFAGGYKFFLSDLSKIEGKRKSNILNGWYLQPEIIAGFYTRNRIEKLPPDYKGIIKKQKVNYQAMLVNLGIQGVIKNKIVIDLFAGVGYGKDNLPKVDDTTWLYFGEVHRGLFKETTGFSFAAKAGLKVGLLF